MLWGIYNTIIVIILLNLLIALMNVAMDAIVENKVASWKYHRYGWDRGFFTVRFATSAITNPKPLIYFSLLRNG